MSLDDLIKKQKHHKGKGAFTGKLGDRGNKFGGNKGFRGGNRQGGGNIVPRERKGAGIFKRGGNQGERFRRGGGRFQDRGGAPRIQRVSIKENLVVNDISM
jgi:hypothetical protein